MTVDTAAPRALIDLADEALHPLRVDPHCHILPGVDDGASDLKVSLAMARRAVANGVQTTVATPHAAHPSLTLRLHRDELRAKVAALQSSLDAEGIPLRLLPGQEFYLGPELPELFQREELITWADQDRHVLIELGFQSVHSCLWDVLDFFVARGLVPIIAHPERYAWWPTAPPELLPRLIEMGCWFQYNVTSLAGGWGPAKRDRALALLARTPHFIIGTDSHDATDRYWSVDEARAAIVPFRAP